MPEPTTYRQVMERAVAQIEDHTYFSDDPPPLWVMALASTFTRALDRNPLRGASS